MESYFNFCLYSDDPDFPSFQQLTGYPVLGKSYSTTVLINARIMRSPWALAASDLAKTLAASAMFLCLKPLHFKEEEKEVAGLKIMELVRGLIEAQNKTLIAVCS